MLGDGDAGLRFSGGLSAWENYFQNVQLSSLFEGFVLQLHIYYQKERIRPLYLHSNLCLCLYMYLGS